MVELFIAQKSQQLVYYVARYLRGQLPQSELHLFIWDTLEEWSQLRLKVQVPPSFQEQVFWHVVHELECWPADQLRRDKNLKRQLQQCLGYLQGKTPIPTDCVGVRP